ncbi:MAG: hypothetical protein GXO40_06510 [Epsilonproteobacteria bacterium]|jgi:hypothetical protein|nr:hypothetical protein [Campylobacterota bacterium]
MRWLILLIGGLLWADNLSLALRYGCNPYYNEQILQLKKEIKRLNAIIYLHNKTLKYILKKDKAPTKTSHITHTPPITHSTPHKSKKLYQFEVIKPIDVYRDKALKHKVFTLPKHYVFKAEVVDDGLLKMRFYYQHYKNTSRWHYVKRDRFLRFDKNSLIFTE